MKKIVVYMLLVCIAFILFGCMEQGEMTDAPMPTEQEFIHIIPETTPEPPKTRLNVGFVGGEDALFSAVDELTNNASTFLLDAGGRYSLNEAVIASLDMNETENGMSYVFLLNEDLYWSDGERVRACDYVLGLLLEGDSNDVLSGFDDYKNGKSTVFSGVRIHDENTFELIVDKTYAGSYYEASFVTVSPKRSTDALAALDDGDGAYLFGEGEAGDVSCGAYMIKEADENFALLIRNESYPGEKCYYDEISLKIIDSDPAQLIAAGEIDICPDAALAQEMPESVLKVSYPASFYKAVFLRCDEGVMADVNVRMAAAYLAQSVGEYPISGDYALSSWQFEYSIDLPKAREADTQKANELLDVSRYIYEEDGRTLFDVSKAQNDGSYLRYDEEKNPLTVSFLMPENDETKKLSDELKKNAPLAGILMNIEFADEESVINEYLYGYDYDGYFLSMNVNPQDNKYYIWHGGFAGTVYNPMGINDEELNLILEDMKNADANDEKAFLDLWISFQQRFYDICPIAYAGGEYEELLISDEIAVGEISDNRSWAQGIENIKPKAE